MCLKDKIVLTIITLLTLNAHGSECVFPNEQDTPGSISFTPGLAGSSQPGIFRYLQVRSTAAPTLSPDGGRLAYLDSTTGVKQVWVIDEVSGVPRQITYGAPVQFLHYSPDNDLILYGVDRQGDERLGFYLISYDGEEEKQLLPPSDSFRNFGGFSADGRYMFYSETPAGSDRFDIFRMDLVGDEIEMVLPGRMGFYINSISPGGAFITLSEERGEASNSLYLLEVATRKLTELFQSSSKSAYQFINWQSDETGFYLASNLDYEYMTPAKYDIETDKLTFLGDTLGDVENLTLTENDNALIWIENVNGRSRFMTLNLSDNPTIELPSLPGGVYEFSKAETADVMAILVKNSNIPGDVWIWDIESGELGRVTYSSRAGLDSGGFHEPESVTFKARDGLTLHGLLYVPAGLDNNSTVPALLKVHGGPYVQARKKFNPQIQYLVSRGMIVLDFNYRGSSGFGKSFARKNDFQLRENELNDLVDAVAWLKNHERYKVDKIAIEGRSYGGYLTMAAMTRRPGLFDAGVATVGVSDWVSALEGASPQLKAADREEYGDITDPDDRAYFKLISPIHYVSQVRAPMLILHGANDTRDPVTESDKFVCALRTLGKQVEYLRFPDEGHGYQKLSNRILAETRTADFLLEHLQ